MAHPDVHHLLSAPMVLPNSQEELGYAPIVRTPPYDFAWPWTATPDDGEVYQLVDDKDQGYTRYGIQAGYGDNSGGTAAAALAVGVYFTPPSPNGQLTISVAPSVNASWGLSSLSSRVNALSRIGLVVAAFDRPNNAWAGLVSNRLETLFEKDNWVGSDQGSFATNGYGLSVTI